MKTILTYGTFDLLHIGHLNMLERLSAMGDRLVVGISSDEFNLLKGKQSINSYSERARIVAALKCVDEVFSEDSWNQKESDIKRFNVDVFGIGDDWKGKFDELSDYCEVVYLERTPSISTTSLKQTLTTLDDATVEKIKEGLDSVLDIVKAIK